MTLLLIVVTARLAFAITAGPESVALSFWF